MSLASSATCITVLLRLQEYEKPRLNYAIQGIFRYDYDPGATAQFIHVEPRCPLPSQSKIGFRHASAPNPLCNVHP